MDEISVFTGPEVSFTYPYNENYQNEEMSTYPYALTYSYQDPSAYPHVVTDPNVDPSAFTTCTHHAKGSKEISPSGTHVTTLFPLSCDCGMIRFKMGLLPENGQLYRDYCCPPIKENNSHDDKQVDIAREDSSIVIEKTRIHPGRFMKTHYGYCESVEPDDTTENPAETTPEGTTEKSGQQSHTGHCCAPGEINISPENQAETTSVVTREIAEQFHTGHCCPPGEINIFPEHAVEITSEFANEGPGELHSGDCCQPVEINVVNRSPMAITWQADKESSGQFHYQPVEISVAETPVQITPGFANEMSRYFHTGHCCPPGEINIFPDNPVEITSDDTNEKSIQLHTGDCCPPIEINVDSKRPVEITWQAKKESPRQSHTDNWGPPVEISVAETSMHTTPQPTNERPGELHSGHCCEPVEITFTTDSPTEITSHTPASNLRETDQQQQNGKETSLPHLVSKRKQCLKS